MKRIFFIISIAAISCCSARKTTDNVNNNNSTDITNKADNFESDATLPDCIKKLIRQFRQEEKANPPRSIYRYTYKGKTVYYVPAICCDFFSDLYDEKCGLIGHPDGGFTGRGDGKTPDFIDTKTNEKLIWKDERK